MHFELRALMEGISVLFVQYANTVNPPAFLRPPSM
jgi:hypothetical protein